MREEVPAPAIGAEAPILYLAQDPECVRRQLAGERVTRAAALPLRDDVSTDEITPITVMHHIDERLADYPYVGFVAGGEHPIGEGDVRRRRIEVVVAGKRFGKGSSREHSPVAERRAGVRVVFAESFERIYRQNADNVGLITSTDLTLLGRLEGGGTVRVEELLAGRDPVSAAIVRAGGLLAFGREHLSVGHPAEPQPSDAPMTLAEKILHRHLTATAVTGSNMEAGTSVFVRADWRFIIEFYTGMAARLIEDAFERPLPFVDRATILGFAEHFSYIDESPAHRGQQRLEGIKELHRLHDVFVRERT